MSDFDVLMQRIDVMQAKTVRGVSNGRMSRPPTVMQMYALFRGGAPLDRHAVHQNACDQGVRLGEIIKARDPQSTPDDNDPVTIQYAFWAGVSARLAHLDPCSPSFTWARAWQSVRDAYVCGFHAARWVCGLEAIAVYWPRGNGDDTPREEPEKRTEWPVHYLAGLDSDRAPPKVPKVQHDPNRCATRYCHGTVTVDGGYCSRCLERDRRRTRQ